MGTHKIYSGIQGIRDTYQGVYMETAMNYLPKFPSVKYRDVVAFATMPVKNNVLIYENVCRYSIQQFFKNCYYYYR